MRLISTPPNLILGTWTALAVGAACCAPNGAPAPVRPAARAAPLCKNPRRVFDMEATSRNNQFNRSLSTYTPHALLCCLNHGGLMCKLSCLLILTAAALAAAELPPLLLWPGTPPGEKAALGPEMDTTKPSDGLVAGKAVIRLGPVSSPTVTMYRTPADGNTGTTVLVFPGGGYNILAMDLEGTEVCQWLNSLGVNCALVKYRVPVRAGLPRHGPPLQDAQRAVGMVRYRAAVWGLDPKRIGVLGFSAGGHLVAAPSTNFDARAYDAVDDADKVSCRPDFTLLIYPAYLTAKSDQGPNLAPELKVTAHTPPSFLIQAEDDSVGVENSLVYYRLQDLCV